MAGTVLDDQQRRQQVRVEVLHLVDEQPEGTAARFDYLGDRLDKLLDVEVDAATRRHSTPRVAQRRR
ncbi:hypothetical protein [Prescottella equi]|uniref:hypothetical protein n=1 Tax=Rhodococcus hoagii TaxID=43767 RepID=UPI000A2321C5|nr:hypothetical protein [Prescottella equi]ORM02885.1 hypothetical protein A5N72_17010 [Prescottella equi]